MLKNLRLYLFLLLSFLLFATAAFGQGAPACLSVGAGNDTTICSGTCITLNANLVTNHQTTSYSVASIPYVPYSYTAGAAVVVGEDDIWSDVENIGFNFCYFGNTVSQFLVGANGQITFDLTNAGGFDNWQNTTALPSTTDMPGNTISCPFRDIDMAIPATGEGVTYQTYGSEPCKALVVSWNNAPLFDNGSGTCDGTPNSTFQCVLYENTNFIDVYISNSYSCTAWNGGFGTIGIQNAAATVAVCPVGRNHTTFSVNGTPEAWRFTPTGPPSYTLNWYQVGSATSLGTTNSISVCPTVNTSYVAVMATINCDGTTLTQSDTVNVNILPPAPPLTVTPATSSICPGGSSVLTAAGGTTYTWSPAAGLSSTTGSPVTASPTTTTTYTVSSGSGVCSSTGTATVFVGATPVINPSTNTICSGDSTVLNASGATTYSWSPANGLSSSTAASPSASPATTTTYTVTGTSGACTGTATVLVTVNPTPIVSATTSASPICVGANVDLTATGATTYSWSPGASTANPFTTIPATTTTYTVTGTSAGCTGTASVQVIVVNTLIVTATAVPTQICIGSPAFLTAAGATTYSWNPSGSSTNPLELNPTTTTTYTVTGNSAGCTGTASVTVTVNPLPTVSFSADTNVGCSPLCVKFTNLSTPNSTTADWFFGDGNSANTITSANNCYQNAGTYNVKLIVTDSLGCQNSETVNNMITVFQSPTADFSMAPQPAVIIDPTVYFTDHSTGGVTQWEWTFGDVTNSSSTLQNPTYVYADTGYYNVQLIVTTNQGCVDSISKVVYVEGDFVLYVPNAFTPNGDGLNDFFQPKGSDIDPNNYDLSIFDRWGNLIFHTTNFYQGWDGRANNGKAVAQEDVYVWRISVKDFKGASHLYIGHVSLIR